MHGDTDGQSRPRGRHRAGLIAIALTLTACLAALLLRTPLRSRYWAWQVTHASYLEQQTVPLANLCNAGDAGRWGISVLLSHENGEIRQFGVLVLQHVRSEWSRRRLLDLLEDPSEAVRELAALGLAIHDDPAITPELERLYTEGDTASGVAACLALERLATAQAVSALTRLVARPADVTRRAALVDALAAIGTPECVPPLLELLRDQRPCKTRPRSERWLERLASLAAEGVFAHTPVHEPTTHPSTAAAPETIAERAAAALARITGLSPPFASDLPREQQADAERIWRQWAATHASAP